jgi:hypothetical protein
MEPTLLQPDDLLVAAIKAELRAHGWYVRTTEWPSGFQVTLHDRADTSRVLVTEWFPTEAESFRAALRLADQGEPRPPRPSTTGEEDVGDVGDAGDLGFGLH